MSNPEEKENVAEEGEVKPEEEEVDEPVDLELQEKMKHLTIDDKIFESEDKGKKEKVDDSAKKGKKSKGVDFMDYANKNNIKLNIQYEQDKFIDKKKKMYPNNQGI